MVRGVISKINQYKSGKGAFIQIDGRKPDYMFFGFTDCREGETVTYEEGKPTRDGKPTIKTIRADSIEAHIDEDKVRSSPVFRAHDKSPDGREEFWANKEKREISKDGIITMLSCLSSACENNSGGQKKPEEIVAEAEIYFQAAMKKKVLP